MNAILASAVPAIGWGLTAFSAIKAYELAQSDLPAMLYFLGLSAAFYLLSIAAGFALLREMWRAK